VVIPATVAVEVDYLVRTRLHTAVHLAFLATIAKGSFLIEELRPGDYARISEICAKYSDADIGLVDASIIAIAERLNEPKVATLDHRHFRLIQPRHVAALELLPH
jgi:predicted nucleic acid-binding protein